MNHKLFILVFLGAICANSKVFAAHHAAHHFAKAVSTTLREVIHQTAAEAEAATEDLIHRQATKYVLGFRHSDVDLNPGDTDLPAHIKTDIDEAKELLDSSRIAALNYFMRNPQDLPPVGDIQKLLDMQVLFCQTDTLLRNLPPVGYVPATEPLE